MENKFKEKFPALYDEKAERIRLKPRHEVGVSCPTVTFRGVPLGFAEDGFINTYCRDNREK
jgi:hypothetical protein